MGKTLAPLILAIFVMNADSAIGSVLIDRIVATVDQEVITESELQAMDSSKEIASRAQLLKQVIENRIILQAAEREGIRISPSEFEQMLQELEARNHFPNREAFRQAVVGSSSLSWERYLSDLKMEMTMMKLMRREIDPNLFVTEAEIKSFYDRNPKKFQNEQVRLKQIFFSIPKDASNALVEEIQQKADLIEGEAKKGVFFDELERTAISSGGDVSDLGFLGVAFLTAEIARAIVNMEVGEVSQKVQTKNGLHFFKVLDRTSTMTSLEEAHGGISEFLLKEKRDVQARAWLNEIKKRTVVEIK
ncbi:MAG: peptidyl-prolyl cis-trans isomerase [Nitrospirae bacterium]|nr:peptidyl-prolyl cis-trans isomerase [Candidatus Troglogloeales bacterium]